MKSSRTMKTKYVPAGVDPLLTFLRYPKGRKTTWLHKEILANMLLWLYDMGIPANYTHINTTIPKDPDAPLRLRYKGKTYEADIAFWYKGKLVHIHIYTFKPEYVKEFD